MSKTDYTCIQSAKDKHANDGSSVQKEEKIKDFTKNGKGGGQVVFHCSFTDIEAHGDFVDHPEILREKNRILVAVKK